MKTISISRSLESFDLLHVVPSKAHDDNVMEDVDTCRGRVIDDVDHPWHHRMTLVTLKDDTDGCR